MQGIYGKPIASNPAMTYTTNLARKATERWTFDNLDRFLKNPKEFAPETAMGIPGIKASKDRRDLIEFLKLP
jgi:cytochrome c